LINVGFTEAHGMAAEQASNPPRNISYSFLDTVRFGSPIFKSPIKGYMSKYDVSGCDIIESVISPVITQKPWVYSLACYEEALAFSYFGLPSPKQIRMPFIEWLLARENCKKLVFWSQAGLNTMSTYGGVSNPVIKAKAEVVYPAIREIEPNRAKASGDTVNILFSGDFFRKGGINVLDAFERIQSRSGKVKLKLCSDERIDFNTGDETLRRETLLRIEKNPDISMGRVPREVMLSEVLPATDIYLLPTYNEAFGFAILEAMAYGIPVISTNTMAIPEIVTDQESGFLIDVSQYDTEQMFKGYSVGRLPEDFRNHVTNGLSQALEQLLDSPAKRQQMGEAGVEVSRTRFSFKTRNQQMGRIYEEAIGASG